MSTPYERLDPRISEPLDDVILVGSHGTAIDAAHLEREMEELAELARTLSLRILSTETMRLSTPHPGTLYGKGTVDRIRDRIEDLGYPAVLTNDQLFPRQQRNLEKIWDVPVLDRTEVILAIFAARATTAEGRIQVEMARLEHLLPRLARGWTHLERQTGGVGLRGGPGEQQIEVDRRLVRTRLKKLKKQLATLSRQRATQRQARMSVPLAIFALVGYTNAGKSTLLNALTNSKVFADNQLFATLDPTSRLLPLASGRRLILTDTVGFIQNLPTELVESFSSTLEEVTAATVHCIIVDVSHQDAKSQLQTVVTTLDDMLCTQERIVVWNKCDLLSKDALEETTRALIEDLPYPTVAISALTQAGFPELKLQFDALAAELVPETSANRAFTPEIGVPHDPTDHSDA